ncbi:hypothetical protein BH10CHL1_BH10CHL1_00860 [soil metagenome]
MATIHYARVDEFWRKQQKYDFLEQHEHMGNVDWQVIAPDKHHLWLTEGMHDEFETFMAMGTKQAKSNLDQQVIFQTFSSGVKTSRDSWVYNFRHDDVSKNIQNLIHVYNEQLFRWQRLAAKPQVDEFVAIDTKQIDWSAGLKDYLRREIKISFTTSNLRRSVYRPFTKLYLYFDKHLDERRYQFPIIFPTPDMDGKNQIICVSGLGHDIFQCLASDHIAEYKFSNAANGGSQCFPFYTYAEDGSNRRENITDWALEQFCAHYPQAPITKWDIFHYVYALLHHPEYRSKYAANLRRELPRIPFVQDFWGFAQAGAQLAELHVHYEKQPQYRLNFIENADKPLNWRVERMKLSKDKRSLIYNDFLTLDGIPPQVFEYKLGNRSALDWIVDQYQVSVDTRSGITNDPNNADDPQAIVRLIGQVITVSLATVQLVNGLPPLVVLE